MPFYFRGMPSGGPYFFNTIRRMSAIEANFASTRKQTSRLAGIMTSCAVISGFIAQPTTPMRPPSSIR
jgi:hypothetical protein